MYESSILRPLLSVRLSVSLWTQWGGYLLLFGVSVSAVELRAQSLLIDDFGNGSSAWSQVHFPDGQGNFDASTGAFQFFMPESAKAVSPSGALFLAALWNGADKARFSDGYWRTTVQAGNPQSAVGMGLRVSPDNPFVAYPFFAVPELGKAFILRAEDGVPPVHLAEMDIDMKAGEDWIMEAGAVGERLSLKLWQAGTVEPLEPQLVTNDSTFDTGMFALAGNVFPEFTADLSASFDQVFFTEQSGFGDEINVVSPRGVEVRDGHGRIPGPTFPVRVQMLYSDHDFQAVPESHRCITGLSLRPDPTNQFTGTATGPLTVRLSTTHADSLGTTYDDNVATGETVVFDSQIHWQSDSSDQFDYFVEFSEPFLYDPANGNLLVDLSTPGLSAASGWWTDNEFPAGPNITFVGGDYQAAVATDAFASLFPLQFTFAQVPEPSTFCLGAVAIGRFVFSQRRFGQSKRSYRDEF